MSRKKLLLSVLCVCAVLLLHGGAVREIRHGEFLLHQFDNPYYTVTVAPESGGRIVRWYDKVKKAEMIRPCLPLKKDGQIEFGGMLDDRGGMSFLPYEWVTGDNNGTGMIRMQATRPDGLVIRKTLLFPPDKPYVTVKYHFFNRSPRVASGLAFGNRNFIVPGGAPRVTPDCFYLVPTTHKIRRREAFTFKLEDGTGRAPEFSDRIWCELSAPWIAFLHGPSGQGMAVSFRDDGYFGSFVWKSGIDFPTWEWTFCDIPAGHEREIVFDLIQVDGMKSLSCVTEQFLADMRPAFENGRLRLETEVKALEKLPALRLTTAIEQIGGKFRILPPVRPRKSTGSEARFDANPPEVTAQGLGTVEPGKSAVCKAQFELPPSGLFRITQTLYSGKVRIARWQDVVTPDHTPFTAAMKIEHRTARENLPIPGWKAEEADRIEVSDEARKKGFAVTEGITLKPAGDNYYAKSTVPRLLKEPKELTIRIASNEIASRELVILPLRLVNGGTARLIGGEEVSAELRQEFHLAMNSRAGGGGIRYAMILRDRKDFQLENPVSFWLRVGSRKPVRPGTYRFRIQVTADGIATELPVTVQVSGVTLPRRPVLSLESEGYPFTFPAGKDPQKIAGWLRNMRDHGIDFFQEFGGYDRVKIAGTDRTLAQDIRKRRKFYEAGKDLPALDFSPHDYWLDPAVGAGLVRFKACYYGMQDPSPLLLHYFTEGAKYIRAQGIQQDDLFFKIRDEQPPDKFGDMARIARMIRKAGFRPFSTFSRLFAKPDELKLLENQFEMFQGGFTTRAERAELIRKKLLPENAVVLTYTGTGTCIQNYDFQCHNGWNAAGLEHDMFHNHCYMRSGNSRLAGNIVYIDETTSFPLDSPSHEGLRDGMTGGNLVAYYRQWRKLIGGRPENRQLFAECDREVKALFEGENALLPIKITQNMGIASESVTRMTGARYRQAHDIMLDILEKIAPAARKASPEVASIRWNGLTVFDAENSVRIDCALPEMKEFFRQEFVRRTGFDAKELDSRKHFRPFGLKTDPGQRLTYRIDRSGDGITITANSPENLKLGIRNFFAVVRMTGFWDGDTE